MNRSNLIGRRASRMALTGVLFASAAFAQASPEDEWRGIEPQSPVSQPPVTRPPVTRPSNDALSAGEPPPAPPVTPMTPMTRAAPASRPRPDLLARIRPMEERNEVSMLGAPPLGAGKRGQMVLLGFPILTVRALFGIGERVDVGLGFDTFYFLMNEPRAILRVGLVKGENWSLGVSAEGGYAFFIQRASRESRSARWLTGRRNINASAALAVSYQGSRPRDARLSFEGRYTLALDTEPFATDPLVGVPPAIVPGHNFGLKGGAELPLSSKTSFVFSFGLDIHGRAEDSVVMPACSIGLVTSL